MSATMQSLNEFIENKSCLNQDEKQPLANAFDLSSDSVCSSDADVDHQLIICVEFRQPVKLSGVKITANAEDETAPQTVKIFQGKKSIGFAEAEDEEATQVLTFQPEDVTKGEAVPVKFVKFQNVNNLQLFFQENYGAGTTKIAKLEFMGVPAEKMDMKEFKPIKG
eukprot:gnl/TRDRNA2_/TRDRNA2_183395_c0_seq1.p1 gnl/TRDRNA2_/TRDRNA2_183395_c0~~gnl/TRDRNA2_/TRDRNA2_183395_c0_seq1.p1  ORF type:complete len:166 (-),score=55.58 gnl/TRDRNA2_/TRDRNA2_183395_c0_seq1:306-803(-)